jgi:hypothetical protein
MHDLNQLISIVLLGGFKNISYYIHTPEHTPRTADVTRDKFACRIDTRDDEERSAHPTFFTQMGRDPGESWSIKNADLFIFPLFVELAAVIVKHPELSEQFADSDAAVDEAVDNAVADANVKWQKSKELKEFKQKKEQQAGKRRKRTRHAHSGHKKRSGNKRSGNKRMSRRR